jgi:hypothetical protein
MRGKPRVERPMPYVRDSFWRGREFTSLVQMQEAADRWSLEVAGGRACRPLDGAAPAAVFAAVEKDALRPLPADPFVLATWAKAKISPDIHARVGKVLYSVPWRHIGKTAEPSQTRQIGEVGRYLYELVPPQLQLPQPWQLGYPGRPGKELIVAEIKNLKAGQCGNRRQGVKLISPETQLAQPG